MGIEAFIFFSLSVLSLTEGAIIRSEVKFNRTHPAVAVGIKRCDPIDKLLRKYGGEIDQWQKNGVHTVCKPKKSGDVCYTPECIHTASTILKNMDVDVDPCDNFYRFACGGFLKRTIIPEDELTVDETSVLYDKLEMQLNAIINAESEPGEPKHYKLVKNLYKSCMNQTVIEARGLEPLHAALKKFGGWPVLDAYSWNDSNFDWRSSMYKFVDTGHDVQHFINFKVYKDIKNVTKRIIYIDQPAPILSRTHLKKGFDDKTVSAYYSYMVDIAVILGAQRDRAVEELKETLNFAIKLADEERYNLTQLYNPMTVSELTKNYPSIPWKEYFSSLLPSSISIEENEIVVVKKPEYLRELEKLMCQTPKRVQANYAMWRIVEDSLYYLNEEVLRRELAFSAAIGGRKKRPPRWNHCIQLVLETFPILVGSLYVRNYFDKETKANAAAMAADVKEHFIRILETVEWMDEKTRNHSVEVANAMSAYIAYPDELLDDEELEKLWPDFDLSEDYFFENIYHLAAYGRNKRFSKLREPIDEKDWKYRVNPTIVNAFYNSALNSFHLPAGILQGDFFNNDRPKYMNYGGIGTIIGHEIAHGFGEIGWQFDENGNKLDWWEPSNKENYLKRTSCIVDQYANQTVQEVNLKLNGTKTQKENMADNRGIKAAYMAYNDWAEVNGPEPQLPGIDRTPQQMFWISIATSSCSVSTPESMKFQIDHNFHSPEEFRVLVPLWNSLEFAKDFKCPVGSKMNPKKKCSVW